MSRKVPRSRANIESLLSQWKALYEINTIILYKYSYITGKLVLQLPIQTNLFRSLYLDALQVFLEKHEPTFKTLEVEEIKNFV